MRPGQDTLHPNEPAQRAARDSNPAAFGSQAARIASSAPRT
jgi:hypothetical protein